MRDPSHKALVDAILDGEIEAEALSKRAHELGKTFGGKLTTVAKAIAARLLSGRIDSDRAMMLYRYFYLALTLHSFQMLAADVHKVASDSHANVTNAAKGVSDVSKVEAIRKADRKAREAERHGKES